MTRERRKKSKIPEYKRYNEIVRDEASITTPIIASNLSTSISIIDIEKYQNIREIGCQKNNDYYNPRRNRNIIIYSDEESTSPSVSPTNTRLFQSKRIQTSVNALPKVDYNIRPRQRITYLYPPNDKFNYRKNAKTYIRNTRTFDRKRLKPLDKGSIQVSYPDVNVHVISMMIPGLNESLIYEKKDELQENEKENVATNKPEGQLTVLNTIPNSISIEDKRPDTTKEVEILWKYTFNSRKEHRKSPKEKLTYPTESRNVKFEANVDSSQVMKQLVVPAYSQRLTDYSEASSRTNKLRDTCQKIEQLYSKKKWNSRFEEVKNKTQEKSNIFSNGENTLCTRTGEGVYWIPKLMQRVQNCYSYFKDILVEKRENNLEHRSDTTERNIEESLSNIFPEKENNTTANKDFITLFLQEKTVTSSTNFVPHITSITSNNPESSLQNPYCRNYFVYFNNTNTPFLSLPMSDLKISNKLSQCGISFIKQMHLLNQQYSCLKDVADVITCLTAMLRKIYEDNQESSYPSTKCFTSIFRIRKIFRKIASINQPLHFSRKMNSKKRRRSPKLSHFQHLEPKEISQNILKINHSLPVCKKRTTGNRQPYVIKDIDVTVISSNCLLVKWKVPKKLELVTKGHKIFLDDVLQCNLMYFETCAILENVDMSKPLSITIMTYTADGYCYSTKVKTFISS